MLGDMLSGLIERLRAARDLNTPQPFVPWSPWNSTHESSAGYFDAIAPRIRNKKVWDVGCGDCQIFANPDRQVFSSYFGFDVLYPPQSFSDQGDFMRRLQAEPASFIADSFFTPDVVLIKDVFQWLTPAQILRVLWNLPRKADVYVTIDSPTTDASRVNKLHTPFYPSSSLWRHRRLPVVGHIPYSVTQSKVAFLAQLSPLEQWWEIQQRSYIPEPCPNCGDGRAPLIEVAYANSTLTRCCCCGLLQEVEHSTDGFSVTAWNQFVQANYYTVA